MQIRNTIILLLIGAIATLIIFPPGCNSGHQQSVVVPGVKEQRKQLQEIVADTQQIAALKKELQKDKAALKTAAEKLWLQNNKTKMMQATINDLLNDRHDTFLRNKVADYFIEEGKEDTASASIIYNLTKQVAILEQISVEKDTTIERLSSMNIASLNNQELLQKELKHTQKKLWWAKAWGRVWKVVGVVAGVFIAIKTFIIK